jgi:hypothetical protein
MRTKFDKIAATSTWKYEVEPVKNIGSSDFERAKHGPE